LPTKRIKGVRKALLRAMVARILMVEVALEVEVVVVCDVV
jgi:hypothetical protein